MLAMKKIVIACFLPMALAQYGGGGGGDTSKTSSTPAPASTTSSSASGVQTVSVGAGGLSFSPNTITAAKGTSVEFVFSGPEHSVVEGSFGSPCAPLANDTGFYSGLISTSSGTNANVFTITINDTNPIWLFCGVPSHCKLGMVAVINAPSDGSQTLAQFSAAAANVTNEPTISVPVQGGTIGPAKAATTGSSTSSAATTSATKSAASKGIVTGGSGQWVVMALTGLLAVGIGSLMV